MTDLLHEQHMLILSEVGHIKAVERFLLDYPAYIEEGYTLLVIDKEVEYILADAGVSFVSGSTYRSANAEYMVIPEVYTTALFASDQWSFFAYRGVSLGHLYALQLQSYITRLLYYADIIATVCKRHQNLHTLVVFPPAAARPAMGSTLVNTQIDSIIDVARCVGEQSGIAVVVPEVKVPLLRQHNLLFAIKRAVFGVGISVLNLIILLLRRRSDTLVVASDYWKNLKPYIHQLAGELVLIDRKECFNIGFRTIWDLRIRFLHTRAFASKAIEYKEAQNIFIREWGVIKQTQTLPALLFREFSLQPLITRALDIVVTQAVNHDVEDIDHAHAMMSQLKPKVVLLRSTISTQTHFVILAQVARAQGIPSVEMQHGLEYYGPSSVFNRHRAEYTGVYGPLTQTQMQEAGDVSTKAVVIGSPRFDVYATANKNMDTTVSSGISLLCIAPAVDPGWDTDTYDTEEYYAAIASMARTIPNMHVVIKLRPGPNRDSFVHAALARVFAEVPYTIAQFEPLVDLYSKATVVVSCFSTALLEALQCGKPLVYLGLTPVHKLVGVQHFTPYTTKGAMRVATTQAEFIAICRELTNSGVREQISQQATNFLAEAYAFDGKGSERAVAFVRSLMEEQKYAP